MLQVFSIKPLKKWSTIELYENDVILSFRNRYYYIGTTGCVWNIVLIIANYKAYKYIQITHILYIEGVILFYFLYELILHIKWPEGSEIILLLSYHILRTSRIKWNFSITGIIPRTRRFDFFFDLLSFDWRIILYLINAISYFITPESPPSWM